LAAVRADSHDVAPMASKIKPPINEGITAAGTAVFINALLFMARLTDTRLNSSNTYKKTAIW